MFNAPKDFKQDFYWKQVQQFVQKVKIIKQSHWEGILQTTLGDSEPETDSRNDANMSTISNYRDELYIPGSPVKR